MIFLRVYVVDPAIMQKKTWRTALAITFLPVEVVYGHRDWFSAHDLNYRREIQKYYKITDEGKKLLETKRY